MTLIWERFLLPLDKAWKALEHFFFLVQDSEGDLGVSYCDSGTRQ